MNKIRNRNYNLNEINIPKQIKKTIQKDKEEKSEQDEGMQMPINPSIFGYNSTPITYNPVIEQEQIAIEKEPVEDFATEETVLTPDEEEMRDLRNEYYLQNDEGVTKDKDFYIQSKSVTVPTPRG